MGKRRFFNSSGLVNCSNIFSPFVPKIFHFTLKLFFLFFLWELRHNMCIISFCVIRIYVKTFFKNQGLFCTHFLCAFNPSIFDYTAILRSVSLFWRNFYVRAPVNFTRLNEKEAIKYEVSRVNVKLSEFQLRRGLPFCLGYPSKRVKVSFSL